MTIRDNLMQRNVKPWEPMGSNLRGFVRCLGDEVMIAEVREDGSTKYHRTSRAAVGAALTAFFFGVRLMLATWPECENCGGAGRDMDAHWSNPVKPCDRCGYTGEEPW